MLLRNIELRNIRSYEHAYVDFPEGTTLLSGDIGSGKTTILLALEFALFGFIRGSISGSTLLRHGEPSGAVTLEMEINGETITLQRTLKRSTKRISQGDGWLQRKGGEKENLSPMELKAKVVEILGYPSSVVSQHKTELFRYTVYTPQEQMKQILVEDADDRLEKLRKIFRIDKYKRIQENAETVAKALRADKRSLKKDLRNLAELKEQLREFQEKKGDVEKTLEGVQKKRETAKKKLEETEEELKSFEEKEEQHKELVEKRNKAQRKQTAVKERINSVEERLETLEEELNLEEDEDAPKNPDEAIEKVDEKLSRLEELEAKIRGKQRSVDKIRAKERSAVENAETLITRIEDLDTCPTCGQHVTDEHAEKVREEQTKKITAAKKKLEAVQQKEEKIGEKEQQVAERRAKLKQKRKAYQKQQKKYAAWKQKQKHKQKYVEEKKQKEDKQKELEQLRSEIEDNIEELAESIKELDFDEEKVKALRDKREKRKEVVHKLDLKRTEQKSTLKNLEERIEEKKSRIEDKEAQKEKLAEITAQENWFSEHFVNLLDVMERHVFVQLHNVFQEHFKNTFDVLIEDDAMLVDLDDGFTPRVTQDGYDAEIESLSGGEKTSVALAYRLALNKVINEFMPDIQTRDILILDEPTDGFSAEQLDRMRDVLHDLDASQILIVSHEPKMQSVTEHVIQVTKQLGRSEVSQL